MEKDHCGYQPFEIKCFCSRKTKFYYQRVNMVLVLIHFIIAAVLTSVFSGTTVEFDKAEDWFEAGGAVRDILVAVICLTMGAMFLLLWIFGCFAVLFRCYFCLLLLIPLTLTFGIALFVAGSIGNRFSNVAYDICNNDE